MSTDKPSNTPSNTPSNDGPSTASAISELRVITDTITRHRERVASVAEPFLGTEREDVVTMVHEAERQLLMATRALTLAIKTLER